MDDGWIGWFDWMDKCIELTCFSWNLKIFTHENFLKFAIFYYYIYIIIIIFMCKKIFFLKLTKIIINNIFIHWNLLDVSHKIFYNERFIIFCIKKNCRPSHFLSTNVGVLSSITKSSFFYLQVASLGKLICSSEIRKKIRKKV